jgi:PIN domain
VPALAPCRVLRLAVDINVFVADILAQRRGFRGSAATMIATAVRDGSCPAGPVQLVTSVPIIENYANVLHRHLGYSSEDAEAKAWMLSEYAIDGPVPESPRVVVGAGYIPFETEEQLQQSITQQAGTAGTGKLFDEIRDDRYVLETALAGRADILVTGDVHGFSKGSAIKLRRGDIVLFPFGGRRLVIGNPAFVAYWLRQGVIPDEEFVAGRPDEFAPAEEAPPP